MPTSSACRPHTTCQRAVLEAKEALEKAGHELVLFDIFSGAGAGRMDELVKIYYGIMSADGKMAGFHAGCEGEEYVSHFPSGTVSCSVSLLETLLEYLLCGLCDGEESS